MREYEVSLEGFTHIHVEAESKEEALEKADPNGFHASWEVTREEVNGPY